MNKKDRDRMGRLYTCVSKMPFPSRNRTIGVEELSRFMRDMEVLSVYFLAAVMSISRCDVLNPEADLEDLERKLGIIK